MERRQQHRARPRLACEIMANGVIAARAADKPSRLELFTWRRLAPGAVAPGLGGPNIQDGEALRAALSSALGAVAGKERDIILIVPDAAIRVLLLDFESLPAKAQEIDPIIRFRLKKSLPFDVEHAAVSYDVSRDNGSIRVVAAVSPRAVMDDYETALRDAGYQPGVVLPSSLAALGLVEGMRPTLVLKVDAVNIAIVAAQNQELRLVRTLENPHGAEVTAAELAEAVLPSIVFFEDAFAARIEQICIGGLAPIDEVGPLLHQHTGAEVRELSPDISSDQNLSGEKVEPSALAGVVGALLG
jgi:type IV pilus assembly protein PilM